MSINRMPESRLKVESLPPDNRWQALLNISFARDELTQIELLVSALGFAIEGACGRSEALALSSVTETVLKRLKSTAEVLAGADEELRA